MGIHNCLQTPTGCTPFRLVYRKACHLPVEIEHKAYWTLKQCNMDLIAAAKNHFMELNELIELRDEAYENTQIYKEQTKKWHESRLRGDKNFKEGDKGMGHVGNPTLYHWLDKRGIDPRAYMDGFGIKGHDERLEYTPQVSQCISEQIPHQKKKFLGGELFTKSSSKMNENENLFVPASMGYDQEMVSKTKEWDERLNPNNKLPNFNTGRIIVLESQAVNESFKPTKNTLESSKDSKAKSLTPLPPLKNLQGASPSSEVMPLTFQPHSLRKRTGLGIMKHKPKTQDSLDKSVSGTVTISETEPTTPSVPTEVKNIEQESKINELTKLVWMLIDEKVNSTQKTQESNSQIQQTESSKIFYCMICKREDHRTFIHEMYTASLKRSENYKAQPYQYASSSNQILKAMAKPFPPCTHYGFNDHRLVDYRNYPKFEIYGSYDHFTSGHNHVIHIRGGVLAESSQSSESSIGVKCNTCGNTVHYTTDHNDFNHFKRETHQGVHLVEQPGPKVVFGDNSSCITEGYGSINCEGVIFTKVAFVNGLKYNLIGISQLCNAKYIVQFDDKEGTIFNANKEIVLIAPRRNDVYVLNISSLTLNGACFFAKAS
ncbi:hypothetical protein Tco_0989220 [Tanacetum coccineum]|uniref:C2H2-type domain-containing protein n=1 Tax=Tanacetum coccineum TaxID=301880 RepID=A0ABQ5ET18_9ASTR